MSLTPHATRARGGFRLSIWPVCVASLLFIFIMKSHLRCRTGVSIEWRDDCVPWRAPASTYPDPEAERAGRQGRQNAEEPTSLLSAPTAPPDRTRVPVRPHRGPLKGKGKLYTLTMRHSTGDEPSSAYMGPSGAYNNLHMIREQHGLEINDEDLASLDKSIMRRVLFLPLPAKAASYADGEARCNMLTREFTPKSDPGWQQNNEGTLETTRVSFLGPPGTAHKMRGMGKYDVVRDGPGAGAAQA
jgi:hypothetical protein